MIIKNTMRQMDSYIRYLSELVAINEKYKLTNNERLLLDIVALAEDKNKITYVKDLILLSHIATQATLHSVVANLVSKKYVRLKTAQEDGRYREVHLTALAFKRYEELSKAMEKAVKK